MISRQDLLRIAARKGFSKDPDIVQKDYALTWALKAIYDNPKLYKYLVFKGGTCLSKVYAENYRLSEDLDFSAYTDRILALEELTAELKSAFRKANDEGAPRLTLREDEVHSNPGMILYKVSYLGPLGAVKDGNSGSIKLDVSLQEHVIYQSERRYCHENTYADIPRFSVHCYLLREIAVEKMRAVMQRGKSRDYYDLWQIMTRKELEGDDNKHDVAQLRRQLVKKCEMTRVPYHPEIMFGQENLGEAENYWKSDLGRLVRNLPEFSEVISKLAARFVCESELAKFSESFDPVHLRNILRQPASSMIVARAIDLAAASLKSRDVRKILSGIKALDGIWLLLSEQPELSKKSWDSRIQPAVELLEELSHDKDVEVKREAGKLLDVFKLKRFGYRS